MLLTGISAPGTVRGEVPVGVSDAPASSLNGKSGAGLASAIRKAYAITTLSSVKDVTYTLDDPFTGSVVKISGGQLPAGYVPGEIVPSVWWSEGKGYGDTLACDLNNFVPLTADVKRLKSDYLPGEVTKARYSDAYWSVGTGVLYGITTDFYAPPEVMRGRLARTFLYMAVMYPQDIFTARGFSMMNPSYPYLQPYGAELFTRWATDYPPSPEEVAWSDYVSSLQGGENPFVTNPSLAEYIWGEKDGQIYDDGVTPLPLRSTYRIGGGRVNLTSPHVPADAVWRIDGRVATSASYAPEELGVGNHNLEYSSPSTGETGRVMIKIQ